MHPALPQSPKPSHTPAPVPHTFTPSHSEPLLSCTALFPYSSQPPPPRFCLTLHSTLSFSPCIASPISTLCSTSSHMPHPYPFFAQHRFPVCLSHPFAQHPFPYTLSLSPSRVLISPIHCPHSAMQHPHNPTLLHSISLSLSPHCPQFPHPHALSLNSKNHTTNEVGKDL